VGSDRQYVDAHPSTALLVVGVAVSSVEADRNMAAIYAAAGVEEYWIVRGREEVVEVYTGLGSSGYTEHRIAGRKEKLVSTACQGVVVDLESLFGA
jgi:Uma2 family endonuclease